MRDIRLGDLLDSVQFYDPMTPQLSKVCFIIFNIVFHKKLEDRGARRVGRQGEKGGERREGQGVPALSWNPGKAGLGPRLNLERA